MEIIGVTKRKLKNGATAGTIKVADRGRRYSVNYEVDRAGHAEQWGASTEVLCFTYPTFEKLLTGELL